MCLRMKQLQCHIPLFGFHGTGLQTYGVHICCSLRRSERPITLPIRNTLLLVAPSMAIAQALQAPYAIPNFTSLSNNTWPSSSEWASLNSSVRGRLQALRPWAAVCYTSDPLYNPEECQSVLSGYDNDKQACFNIKCVLRMLTLQAHQREAVPAALLWQNWEACSFNQDCALNYSNPQRISNATCHQGTTPPYSISILDAQDASTVIRWATAHKVKLTVKNTG